MRCYHISKLSWALAILFAWAVLVAPALAIDSTWNADADGNWSDAAKWTAGIPNAIGDIARLTYNITAPRTVTIDGGIPTVGSLYLSGTTSGCTLAGVGLNLEVSSGLALIQASGAGITHTISAPVELYDSATVAVSGGILEVSGAISSGVAGTGITKTGAATLNLSATNTYTGATSISGGALGAVDGTSLPAASFLSLDGGILQSSGTFTRPLGTSGTALQWTTNGGGFSAAGGPLTVNVGGNATPTELVWGTTAGSNIVGTLKFGSSTADSETEFRNNVNLARAARTVTVTDNPSATTDFTTLSGVLSNGGLIKGGSGVLVLSGTNTYVGSTTVSGGVLQAAEGRGLPTASPLLFTGGAFQTSGSFTRPLGTAAGQVKWTGSGGFAARGGKLTVAIGGTANPTTLIWDSGGFVPRGSQLVLGSLTADSETEFANNINLAGETRIVQVNDNPATTGDFVTLSGVLSNGNLQQQGPGTLVLKGTLTRTGNNGEISVYQGTLRLGSSQALASGTGIEVRNGGTLDMAGYSLTPDHVYLYEGTIAGMGSVLSPGYLAVYGGMVDVLVAGAGGVEKIGYDTVVLTGKNTYSGSTGIQDGTLRANDGVGLSPASTLYFGSGVLEITGGGTFTRSIGKGPGQVWWWPTSGRGGFAALGGKVTVAIGGTASPTNLVHGMGVGFEDLRFGSATADSEVEFKNNIDVGNAFLYVTVVDNPDSTGDFATLSGDLTNGYVLDKMGTGVLVLSGTNTLSSAVVDSGTLRLGSGHALGTVTDVTVSQSGTLDVGTYGNAVGSLTLMGGSIIGNGSLISAGTMSLQWGTISASLGGTGGLDKWDVYTVDLAGANTYSGVTTVSWGTLRIGSDKAIPSGGALVITYDYVNGSGAIGTLDIGAYNVAAGTVTLTGGAIVGSTGVLSATNLDARKGTITASLGGTGTFTKTTNDLVTLGGANTFTGPTIVSGGTLRLATNNAIPSGGNVTVQGGILDIGAYDPNAGTVSLLGGAITGSKGVLNAATLDLRKGTVSAILGGSTGPSKSTADTVALTAANAYSGPTIVYGGALQAVSGTGLPSASNLVLAGGVLEGIGATTFTRTPGASGANTVRWTGSGGFSASGGKMTVAIGGTATPTALTWASGNFVPSGSALMFGSTTADSETEFRNNVDLGGATQTVTVNDNPATAADFAALSGVLSNGGLSKDGSGMLVLSGANTYTGTTAVKAGALRATSGAGLPAASNLILNGGVLEGPGATTFTRSLGTSGTNTVQWTGSGGFSASGSKMIVAIGGTASPTALTWASGSFVPSGSALVFGSTTSDSQTEFRNNINLAGAAQTVKVDDNPATAADFATLSGVLSNGGLSKDGSGLLVLSGANTYTGATTVKASALRAPSGAGLPAASNLILAGGVLEGLGATTFSRNLGASGTNTVQWTGSGGFSASGGKMTVAIGGTASPTALTWASGGFVPSGSALVFGSTTADNATEFRNNINLAGAAQTVTVNDNPATAGDFATLSGVLSNGGLSKDGSGMLVLSGANTYTGATTVKASALRATSGAGLPAASNLILAGGVLEGLGATTFSRNLGTSGTNTVQWTGSGGFSASGGKMTVAMGGTASPTALNWGSGNFVPSGSALLFGSGTADSETEFCNTMNLAGDTRTVWVSDNPFSTGDFATISGKISNGASIKDGPGILVLKGSHAYSWPTIVAAGTLKLAAGASLASPTFDVAASATLDVTDLGSFALGAGKSLKGGGTILGDLVVGGTLSPGESPGILSVEDITFAAGSILNMELGGTVRGGGYDALVSSGGVVLQDGSRLTVSLISSFVPQMGDEFDVLDFSSLSGQFTTISLPALAGGLSWSTDELYLDGTIGITPEPATLALLALGSLALLSRRRK